jgi:hypothetical protein
MIFEIPLSVYPGYILIFDIYDRFIDINSVSSPPKYISLSIEYKLPMNYFIVIVFRTTNVLASQNLIYKLLTTTNISPLLAKQN